MEQRRENLAEVNAYCAQEDCTTEVDVEGYSSPIDLKVYCWDCMDNDLTYASTLYRYSPADSVVERVRFGDIAVMNEYGDEPGKWFWDLFNPEEPSRDWIPTDGWRGYMSSVRNMPGVLVVADGWTTGWADENTKRKMIFNQWLTDLIETDDYNYDQDVFILMEPTSNVFSISVTVFVKPGAEEHKNRILQSCDLQYALS